MQMATIKRQGSFLHSLELVRVCAVLLVLLQHETLLARNYLGLEFASGIFSRGQFRIDLFFLLSGFFATWLGGDDQRSKSHGLHLLGHRMRRLLPLLWVLTTFKLVLIILTESAGRHAGLGWFQILRSYTLLPASGYPILLPAWTLSFELVFSAMCSVLLCGAPRVKFATMLLWALAIILHGLMSEGKPALGLPGFALHPYFLDFIAGALIAKWVVRTAVRTRGAVMLAAMGGLSLALCFSLEVEMKSCTELARRIAWGGSSALIIAGLALWESRGGKFDTLGRLRLLAQSSYSIYLTHSFVLVTVIPLLSSMSKGSIMAETILIGLAMVACLIGIGLHIWLEKPLLLWLRLSGPFSSQTKFKTPVDS